MLVIVEKLKRMWSSGLRWRWVSMIDNPKGIKIQFSEPVIVTLFLKIWAQEDTVVSSHPLPRPELSVQCYQARGV